MEIIFEIIVWILNLEVKIGYYLRIRLIEWFCYSTMMVAILTKNFPISPFCAVYPTR
jgi:hypothetical protein